MNQRQKFSRTKFIAYVAASVDGRISIDSKHPPEWTSREDWRFFQRELAKADAVIAGRKTYEAVRERMQKRNLFVFSKRLGSVKRGRVTFLNPDKSDLPQLFSRYKVVAIVGGASVYQNMLDRGLLDEIYVTVEPLIFGRGRPMFEGGKRNFKLKLISLKKLNDRGTTLLHYKVLK